MAKGDRVVIGDGLSFKEGSGSTMVYLPRMNQDGSMDIDLTGAVSVIAQGGVKNGSSATIDGPVIKVHRSQVQTSNSYVKGIGGNDFINMIPVFLDAYQRLAYLPVDNVRLWGSFTN